MWNLWILGGYKAVRFRQCRLFHWPYFGSDSAPSTPSIFSDFGVQPGVATRRLDQIDQSDQIQSLNCHLFGKAVCCQTDFVPEAFKFVFET